MESTTSPVAAAPLPILHRPCAWHESPMELARLNREFPGQVSHGLCNNCRVKLEAEAA